MDWKMSGGTCNSYIESSVGILSLGKDGGADLLAFSAEMFIERAAVDRAFSEGLSSEGAPIGGCIREVSAVIVVGKRVIFIFVFVVVVYRGDDFACLIFKDVVRVTRLLELRVGVRRRLPVRRVMVVAYGRGAAVATCYCCCW